MLHGRKHQKLTESEELMLTGQPPNRKQLVVAKKLVKIIHPTLVNTTKGTHAHTKVTMKQEVVLTCIFVVYVMRKERMYPTPEIVVNQKTIRALQKCSIVV